jgi:drug/metabolite transporter (DMT)-like permease
MGTVNYCREYMNITATILWLICLSCETVGQLIFKAVAHTSDQCDGLEQWKVMLKDFRIWIGISCYVIEFLLYMAFLSLVPLAQGVLICSMSIMTVMIGGRLLFGETLSPKRVSAGLLIAAGVSLVGWC